MQFYKGLENAPRGTVRETPVTGKEGKIRRTFVPDWLLLAVSDKGVLKVIPGHFVEPSKQYPEGRWAGCADKQVPYAWAPWPAAPDPEDFIPW